MHATARTLTILVFSALVWCPPAGAEAEKSITVWWAQWDPAVGLQKLGDEFAAETGIAVEVHQIPWASYQDQVFLNFGNRQTDFDIVVGDSQWIGPRRHPGPLPRADRLAAAARRHRGHSPPRAPFPDGVSPGKRQVFRGPVRDRRPRLRVPQGLVRGPCRAGGVRGEARPLPAAPRHLAGVPRGRRVLPPAGGRSATAAPC